MPPGADPGCAGNRQIGDGSVGLRSANVKSSQVKDTASKEKMRDKTGEQAPVLSARERLRLHVNRNLALQQEGAKTGNGSGGIDKGPASAGAPPAPPRGASPANPGTPPPTTAQPHSKNVANPRQASNGLDSLYGPITDNRLGKGDISQGPNSSGSAVERSKTNVASPGHTVLSPVDSLNVPLNMSMDMADTLVESSGLVSGEEETTSGFDSSDITETPPFIPTAEWGETSGSLGVAGLSDSSQLYYNEDGCRGGPDAVVDDDWVQGLYDMEGMADTA